MATRSSPDQGFLSDLVERRIEAPEVEYKNWLPLTDKVERAKIARHLGALANAGGGWLVFGFDDDGSESEPYPESLDAYDQDALNAIGERYLEPQPHCEVHLVAAASGRIHPVVRVPSHGAVPVCAKRDGPHDDKGQPQGIRSGIHYVRTAGPRSVAMEGPEHWRDVIRRCVLAERTTLIASIGQLFDGPRPSVEAPKVLDEWLDQALQEWNSLPPLPWPVPTAGNRSAFAFRFVNAEGEAPAPLALTALDRAIRDASFTSKDVVNEGAAFESGWDTSNRAKVVLVGDSESLETRHLPAGDTPYTLPVIWRIGTDGLGVEVSAIAEDNPWVREAVEQRSSKKWPPGGKLAPSFQADMMAQRIAFVRQLATTFPDAVRCEMVVDYAGLKGRGVDEPRGYFSMNRTSSTDSRRSRTSIGIAALAGEIPETTALLVAPIFRLFDGWEFAADYVLTRLTSSERDRS